MKNIIDQSMYNFIKTYKKHENDCAIAFMNEKMSRDDFYYNVDCLSSAFIKLGIKKGESVGLFSPNVPSAVIIFYALNQIGAIVNIIHPLAPTNKLIAKLKETNTKWLVMFDMFFNKHKKTLEQEKINVIVNSAIDYLSNNKTKFLKPLLRVKYPINKKILKIEKLKHVDKIKINITVKGDDVACYMHSSGTSGQPKTVMLSNKALNALCVKAEALVNPNEFKNEAMLMVLPMFHCFGLGICMHTSFGLHFKAVLMPSFNAKKCLKLIKDEQITFTAGIPSMYEKMCNCNTFQDSIKSLKHMYCGGDKLTSKAKNKFDIAMAKGNNNIQLLEGYGLTELVGVSCVNTEKENKFPSIGKPLEGLSVKILDSKNNPLPENNKGEIAISGDTNMVGYLNSEIDNQKTMITIDNKIYIKTGDLGYIDNEGYVYFIERIKRMIKISGMNVFPAEIESYVNKLHFVKNCCAVEDNLKGKPFVSLYIVLSKKIDKKVAEENILNFLKENLLKYSLPRKIIFVNKLPVNNMGKIDYKKLENKYKFN